MKINPVANSTSYVPAEKSAKAVKTEAPVTSKDKIEISDLAKSLKSADQSKISAIKEKIDSGFYNSDTVIEKVAEEILKEIRGE